MAAILIEYFKQDIRGQFIMEIKIWRMEDNRYPHDLNVHLNDLEISYEFSDVPQLRSDFKNYVFQHFGEKI